MTGKIFDIKRYAIHDGPGIRTTVFFKGCPLKCKWCHNPESISLNPSEMIQVRKLGDRKYTETIQVGYDIELNQLIDEIKRDAVFYDESGGGVTFSGGEPLLQHEFLLACLKECKKNNIHTCIDTAGSVENANLKEISQYTDLYLFDIKTNNEQIFKDYIGTNFQIILDNLRKIASFGNQIIIRIPVIPNVNSTKEEMQKIADFLKTIPGIKKVNLLPFHRTGADKYQRLGKNYEMGNLKSLSEEDIQPLKELFKNQDFEVK